MSTTATSTEKCDRGDLPSADDYADLNRPFASGDRTFDYAFCIDGPKHAENLYHAFREFFRVLRPGGRLVLSIPNYANIESRLKQRIGTVMILCVSRPLLVA